MIAGLKNARRGKVISGKLNQMQMQPELQTGIMK